MSLVLLQTCGDNAEASALRALLDAHGIGCVIQGEQHRSMMGMMGAFIELRVLVDEEALERAREVLGEAEGLESLPEDEAPGAAPPQGAVCPVHERAASATCSRCGSFLCTLCGFDPAQPSCEDCLGREAGPQPRALRRRLTAGSALMILFGLPVLIALAAELIRRLGR